MGEDAECEFGMVPQDPRDGSGGKAGGRCRTGLGTAPRGALRPRAFSGGETDRVIAGTFGQRVSYDPDMREHQGDAVTSDREETKVRIHTDTSQAMPADDRRGNLRLLCCSVYEVKTVVAGGPGFEPGLEESESTVLPLNYPPKSSRGRGWIRFFPIRWRRPPTVSEPVRSGAGAIAW